MLSSQKLSAQSWFVPYSLVVTSSDTEAGVLAFFTEGFIITLYFILRYVIFVSLRHQLLVGAGL